MARRRPLLHDAGPTPDPVVLFCRDSGTGPPVLLLHGVMTTGEVFHLIVAALGGSFRLLRPDLRGHGRSGHLPGPDDPGTVAADLGPTLDALGLSSVHLVGYSHGGAAAQAFARAHPDRVRSLVLVGAYTFQPLTWWERLGGRLAPAVVAVLGVPRLAWLVRQARPSGGGGKVTPTAAARGATTMMANDSHRMASALRATRCFDSRDWLGEIRVPTLVIGGGSDRIVAPRQARLLATGIPDATLHVLPGAGHLLPLSHPDELARLVTAWIATVEATPPRGDSSLAPR